MKKETTKNNGARISRFNIVKLRRRDLEELKASGKKTSIEVVGMLFVDDDVSPELAMDTIDSVNVYGPVLASNEVRSVLMSRTPDVA